MRRSQFTENEIRHLLYEANTGVSVAEICTTSGISLRTFYRWRRRYGGLDHPAVLDMRGLAVENVRLRNVIDNLSACLKATPAGEIASGSTPQTNALKDVDGRGRRAISIAAEKCGGAVTGRFASIRVNR
ncbi:transposase [Bradyrhizobium septentrionale]|uniref:Transposase n=1 Tax=Bradyrhizobium septentrionale TaxID=1404411 RepID=A0A973W782_9BRAD|nr:transposase [Bradyrhizobium septentrionale]UGY17490.1 transposase [Bradyrhizobium septentrionale]